jgi:hypothetical protein
MARSPIMLAIVIFAMFQGSLQVDDEYCSLNLSKDECVSKTKNGDCFWLTFTHQNGYGRDIDGCFDYRFIVNSLKFVVNPKGFDTMSDGEICQKLGQSCTSVTKTNFESFFKSAPAYSSITKITAVGSVQCHN